MPNENGCICWFNDRDPIEKFIDENKALIRRMYGEFQAPPPGSDGGSGGGGGGGNRRSVRQAPGHHNIRDSELFAEDLEADGFSPDLFGFKPSGNESLNDSVRNRRQNTNNNRNNSKDNKWDYSL